MSNTYLGSNIAISMDTPATYDVPGFEALTWETGDCALHAMPALSRAYNAVDEPLVCNPTTFSKKGMAKYDPVTYTLSDIPNDPAQLVYELLEDSSLALGSFRFFLTGVGIFYFTAQVSKFAISDGGSGDTIQTRAVELLLAQEPIKAIILVEDLPIGWDDGSNIGWNDIDSIGWAQAS